MKRELLENEDHPERLQVHCLRLQIHEGSYPLGCRFTSYRAVCPDSGVAPERGYFPTGERFCSISCTDPYDPGRIVV